MYNAIPRPKMTENILDHLEKVRGQVREAQATLHRIILDWPSGDKPQYYEPFEDVVRAEGILNDALDALQGAQRLIIKYWRLKREPE